MDLFASMSSAALRVEPGDPALFARDTRGDGAGDGHASRCGAASGRGFEKGVPRRVRPILGFDGLRRQRGQNVLRRTGRGSACASDGIAD